MMTGKKKEPASSPAPAIATLAVMDATPVADHQFGVGLISLFADLVLKAATSQRAAAAVLRLVAPYVSGLSKVPCANSGRMWLMRIGLHELLRKKEAAKDWVWIMDHTVQLTELAFLVPPGLRNKARYMNLDTLVDWGCRVLAYLDDPRDVSEEKVDRRKLEQKLGWLREYREALATWAELLAIAKQAEGYVRTKGYHRRAAKELKTQLRPFVRTPAAVRLQAGLLKFLDEQTKGIKRGRHLLGSSEILESLLGKYKRIQGTHSKGGMTGSLLNIGAAVSRKSTETIRKVLSSVPVAAVGNWIRDRLGLTIPSQQALAFRRNTNCPKHPVLITSTF